MPFPTYAANYTCDMYGNYFNGYYDDVSTHSAQFEGSSGTLTSNAAYTCSTDTTGPNPGNDGANFTNFTTNWVMIASHNLKQYSQAGYIAGYYQIVYTFAEVSGGPNNSFYDRYLPGTVQPDSTNGFYEKFEYGCSQTNTPCIASFEGNDEITETSFNPYATGGFGPQPWSPQYSEEKSHQGSDVMGTASDPANFTNLGGQQASNDQYEPLPCMLSQAGPIASRSAISAKSCTNFNAWST